MYIINSKSNILISKAMKNYRHPIDVDVCYQDVLTRFPQNEMIKNFEAGGFELSKFPLSRYAHGTCDVDFQRWQ